MRTVGYNNVVTMVSIGGECGFVFALQCDGYAGSQTTQCSWVARNVDMVPCASEGSCSTSDSLRHGCMSVYLVF